MFKKFFEDIERDKRRKADKRFAKGPGFFERAWNEATTKVEKPKKKRGPVGSRHPDDWKPDHWKEGDWEPGDSEYPYEKDGSYKTHQPDFVEEKRIWDRDYARHLKKLEEEKVKKKKK